MKTGISLALSNFFRRWREAGAAMSFAPSWFPRSRDAAANWAERVVASAPRWVGFPTSITVSQGGTYSFAPYAFDDDGDVLTYSLVSPPSGYSINAATGLLTAGSTLGTQSITVRATDPAGLYAEAPCAVTVQAGAGTFTIPGSNFGSRSQLAPLFYRFFAPGEISDGAVATAAGYSLGVGSVFCDVDAGYVPGNGCLTHTTTLGQQDSFPHLYWVPPTAKQGIFQSYAYRLTRVAGSVSGTFQMKAPRTSYGTEYTGIPRVTSSFYHSLAADALSYTNMSAFAPSEAGDDDFDVSSTYKTRFRPSGWNTVENWTDWGSVGAANGFQRIWLNGAQVGPFTNGGYNTEALAIRSSSAQLIEFVSLFPGLDFPGQTTSQWRVEFAEHYVDDTPARVVIGNAATWSACTHKQIMLPTAWSETSVTASWRPLGFASSGQTVYGYVVNSSGTVSPATALVVP